MAILYRLVQLNSTPEIEIFHMLFDRSLSIFSMKSLKQHMECFNFRCINQLDLIVPWTSSMIIMKSSSEMAKNV